jgi:microcystin-dependent protein
MAIDIPLWLQGGAYSARMDRLVIAQLWEEGVADLSCFKVGQRAAGANFSVDISAGEAVIQGDDQTNQGSYLIRGTIVENATIAAAPGSNSRIDLIGLRINDPNAGGSAGNTATPVVTTGTVAASPVAPATPSSTLPLAYVTVAAGQASILATNITDARVLMGIKVTPGTIREIAYAVANNGWAFCDGSAKSRTTFARLFAMIGTSFGVGDGSTTFNLPDFRGRVGVAVDNMGGTDAGRLGIANVLGTSGGSENVTLGISQMPNHSHADSTGHRHHPPSSGGQFYGDSSTGGPLALSYAAGPNPIYGFTQTDVGNVALDATGGGGSHTNMQPYIVVNKIIKV